MFARCSSPIPCCQPSRPPKRHLHFCHLTLLLTTVSLALLTLPLPLELAYGLRLGYCCWAGEVSAMADGQVKGELRDRVGGSVRVQFRAVDVQRISRGYADGVDVVDVVKSGREGGAGVIKLELEFQKCSRQSRNWELLRTVLQSPSLLASYWTVRCDG